MMRGKMTSEEIIKLLDNLIGPTEAYGDSAVDEKILVNLKTLIDVTNWCLDGVKQSAGALHRTEDSMRRIGATAMSALLEWEEWIRGVRESE